MAFSVKKLTAHFGSEVAAEFIRKALQIHECGFANVQATLASVSAILDAHGVECVYPPHADSTPNHDEPAIAAYVNTGDTYSATLLFDVRKGRFLLTTWGDWYEKSPEYRRYSRAQATG